jgi:hypothetical protein
MSVAVGCMCDLKPLRCDPAAGRSYLLLDPDLVRRDKVGPVCFASVLMYCSVLGVARQ